MRLSFCVFLLLLTACSQHSTKKSSIRWHDFNAKYNAYLQAKDNLKVAEFTILEQYKDNYSETLPVLIPLDSNNAKVATKELDAILKKSSLIAEKHQNSKYLGNAYNLIGKARLYKGDFLNAIETFKYVNTEATKESQKHEALTLLMRAYLESSDDATALRVADILAQQNLNKANSINFYLTKAQLHQKQGETKLAAEILDEALSLMKKSSQKARLHFVAGQLYDKLGDVRNASEHYKQVAKNNPSYDLAFYSSLNKTMFSVGSNMKENFEKLVKDRKNIDLLDKLYYSMALLDEKSGNIDEALKNLEKATKAQGKGTQNKASAYLKMGDIHYFRLQNYDKSKAYYDSALVLMQANSPEYEKVANRKRALDEYAVQQSTIKTEDSLQRMAAMDSLSLDEYLNKAIKAQLDREKKAVEAAKKANEAQAQANITNLTSNGDPSKRWYFYNETALMNGRIEFTQRWGQRKLEDNWRRQVKDAVYTDLNTTDANNKKDDEKESDEIDTGRLEEIKNQILKSLPNTAKLMQASKDKQAVAYFNLGKIYKLYLLENENAKKSFESHLNINPKLEQAPEAIYYLALLTENTGLYDTWKNQLLNSYPNTYFARKLSKGKDNLSKDEEAKAADSYEKAYNLYIENQFSESLSRAVESLKMFPGSSYEDKFSFLKILNFGKLLEKDKYIAALDEFLQAQSKSDLIPLAKELKEAMSNIPQNK